MLTPEEYEEIIAAQDTLTAAQQQEIDRLLALVRQLSGEPVEPPTYPVDPERIRRAYAVAHNIAHQVKVGHARLIWPTGKRSGPYVPDIEGTPHQLWGYIQTNPPWPWNIRVLANGAVEQREGMTQDEINEAEYVLWGGHNYDLDMTGELYATLVGAGYDFIEGQAP